MAGRARLSAVVAGFLAPSLGHAASLAIGGEYFDHDFTEFNQADARIVNESGRMFAHAVGIEHAFEVGLTLAAHYWSADGSIDYDGATQSGRPLLTSADQEFDRGSALAAYRIEQGDWFFRVQAVYSVWRWERRIGETMSSQPLDLDYRWNQLSLGLGFGHALPWGEVSLSVERLENDDARVRLDLERFGAGRPLLKPKDDDGARLTLAHEYRFSSRWSTTQYLYFEQQGFAASDTVGVANGTNISLFTEPRSETRRIGIGVVFTYMLER